MAGPDFVEMWPGGLDCISWILYFQLRTLKDFASDGPVIIMSSFSQNTMALSLLAISASLEYPYAHHL